MFSKGEPAAWFEYAAQPNLYRWNKFRSSLERDFGSFGSDWERRMIKEFRNCTNDSSNGGFGWYEGANHSDTPGRDAGDDNNDDSNGSDNGDDEEDPEEESDGDKT